MIVPVMKNAATISRIRPLIVVGIATSLSDLRTSVENVAPHRLKTPCQNVVHLPALSCCPARCGRNPVHDIAQALRGTQKCRGSAKIHLIAQELTDSSTA